MKKNDFTGGMESFDFTKTIINSTSDSIIVVDLKGEITFWNKAAAKFYKYTEEEILGKSIALIYKDENTISVKDRIKSILLGERVFDEEVKVVDKFYKDHTVLLSLNSVKNKNGKITHVVGITKYFIGKDRAEEKLQEAEALFSSAINSIGEGFVVQDLEGKILSANQAASGIFGLTMGQLLGSDFFRLIPKTLDLNGAPFKSEKHPSVITNKTGKSVNNVLMNVYSGKNHRKWFLINSRPVLDINEKHISTVTTFLDITERKKAEEKLKESEQKFSQAFDNSPIPISILNLNTGKRVAVNNQFCKTFGYTKKELLDEEKYFIQNIVANQEEFNVAVKKAIKYGTILSQPLTIKTKSGDIRHVLVNSTKAYDNNDEVYITSYIDVTEERLARQALEESEQKFRNLAEAAKVSIAIYYAASGKGCLYVNNHWVKSSGYSKKEAKDLDVLSIVAPEFKDLVRERGEKRLSGEKVSESYEIRVITKAGKSKWIEFSATIIEFEGKKAILTTAIDITERKEVEAKLRQSTLLLQASQKIAQVGGWELDISTGNLFWTAETYRIHDTTPSEFNPTVDAGVGYFLPESRKKISKALKLAVEKGIGYDLELETYTTKGRFIYVRTTCEVTLKDGKPAKLMGIFQDVSKQKLEEAELIDAKENAEISKVYLDRIINNIGDAVFVKDEDSRLVLVNDAFCLLRGLDRKDVIGKTLAENVKSDEWEGFIKIDKQVLETGKESIVEESFTVKGRPTQINFTRKTRYIDANNKKYLIGVSRDVTKQRIVEQKIKESEAHISAILNSLPSSVFVIDYTGKILQVNESRKGFGIANGVNAEKISFLDYNYFDVCKSDLENKDATSVLKGLNDLFKGNIKKFEYEYPCHTPNEKQWFFMSANLMKTKEKQVVISHVDITSRKLSEEQLKKTLFQRRIAVKTAELGLWTYDIKTGKLFWDDKLFEIYGITTDEFDNTLDVFKDLVYPGDYKIIDTAITKVFNKKTVFGIKFRILHSSGEVRYIDSSAAPVLNGDELIKIVGVSRDVSETVISQKELKKAFVEISELKLKLEAENIYLKEELRLEGGFEEIIGSSKSLKKVLEQVEQVAKTDATVLVLGETGTGKELIAKAVHAASNRKNMPLVKVNCSALPAELIESELFGHEKGAFTGAMNRKIGRFELADKGTIFLDEIGDLPIDLQTRFLRVLQESEFERLGGGITMKVDVRVVAATNRNLEELVVEGKFRQDLYYRLNVFPVTCPPLRNRKEDISSLVNHFVNKYNNKVKNRISSVSRHAIDRLMEYNWPGNIRELEHVIERAVVLNYGSQLRLGKWFVGDNAQIALTDEFATLEQIERDYISKVLKQVNGRIRGENGAAEILGLKPTTLDSRIKKLNISKKE